MDKYGLIGYPLGHSFSIGYFNEKFENEGAEGRYLKDGLHPKENGQALQGAFVAKEIRNNFFR